VRSPPRDPQASLLLNLPHSHHLNHLPSPQANLLYNLHHNHHHSLRRFRPTNQLHRLLPSLLLNRLHFLQASHRRNPPCNRPPNPLLVSPGSLPLSLLVNHLVNRLIRLHNLHKPHRVNRLCSLLVSLRLNQPCNHLLNRLVNLQDNRLLVQPDSLPVSPLVDHHHNRHQDPAR
jgi:hypothetical protein